MDQLFAFLFKYRPAAFERGALAFEPPGPWWLVLAAGIGAAALAVLLYARAGRLPLRDRIALSLLRAGALAVLVLCLAGPVLLVATASPQRNVVAVLVDDSRSMGVRDAGDTTRFAAALESFAPETGEVTRALAERFQVRTYRYSELLAPFADGPVAPANGRQTDLAAALTAVRERLAGEPVAGVVVASDGGDNAGGALTDALLAYRAAGIPVHTVGYGADRFDRDVALEMDALPERVPRHATVVADVRVRQRGYAGESVNVIVEDGGAIVGQSPVRLGANGAVVTVPVSFTPAEPGPRRIRVRVAVQRGEIVSENNAIDAMIVVHETRERVLYFEGEPRFEVKFLRRALLGDEQLHVTTLQRTADEKFLRLDVIDSSEVAAGFPRTRAELFGYRALVLGSVEASFFTRDQLSMIAEFVRERGGGLLVLGGRRAFTTGGYAGTAVADALPVVLPREADSAFFREVDVQLTAAGRRHPALRLDGSGSEASQARWDSLPPLSIAHAITAVKPGATALLTGDAEGGPYIVLASQRYGRGRSAAFPVQDSWMWQMHAAIPLEDQTHETLWRQLLRWLVTDVPDQVTARPAAATVLPGRAAALTADVLDSAYRALNGAEVVATVRAPDGTESTAPLAWSVEKDGEYRGVFTPLQEGTHEIVIDARHDGRLLGSARAFVHAGDPRLEFAGAERRSAVLRRVSDETGGRFYEAGAVAGLAQDVPYSSAGVVSHERLDLWDMPVLLIALIALIGAEWSYRRVRGLA